MAGNIRPAGVFDTSYDEDMALFRTPFAKIFWGVAFLIALFVPLYAGADLIPHFWVGIILRLCITIVAVQGLNILTGYTGQLSLGHSAFIAVGAYTSAILGRELGLSFFIVLPISALFTGFIGLLFGLPSLRVKGFYLAMATLAAQFIIPWVLEYPLAEWTNGNRPLNVPAPIIGPFNVYETYGSGDSLNEDGSITFEAGNPIMVDYLTIIVTGDSETIPEISVVRATVNEAGDILSDETLAGSEFTTRTEDNLTEIQFVASKEGVYTVTTAASDAHTVEVTARQALSFADENAFYYIAFPLTVLLVLAGHNIIRTRTGRAFISVRDNDLAAELLGINVFTYKLRAFFISAVYAGISGTLLAYETNSLSLDFFSLQRSVEMLAMVIIGGAGFPLGAVFGTAFFNLFNDVFIPSIGPFIRQSLLFIFPTVPESNIFAAINPVMFGLALMIFLILEPRGLAYRWEILKIAWKIRPYSY